MNAPAAVTERPDPKVVRLLESYGYRAEAVRRWSAEKAATVLRSEQNEQRIALRRADRVAAEQDGSLVRGQPSQVERLVAADAIEQGQAQGVDELGQRVMYTVYALTDDELKRLAGYLIRLFRGQA